MKFITVLFTLTIVFSCNRESNVSELTKSDILTSSEWKKDYYENSYYNNDILEKVDKDETHKGIESIKFNSDLTVKYNRPEFFDKIDGNWNFENDETILKTSLYKFGGYYFPSQKINILNEKSLVLEMEHLAIISFNTDGTENIRFLVRKFYFTR